MNDRIELTGIEVYAKHGVLDREQQVAQIFRVDVVAWVDLQTAGRTDELEDTVDYGALASEIRDTVGSESNRLIEKVATRVATVVLAHPEIVRTRVTVHKPDAPVDVALEDVSVVVERGR